MKLLLETTGSFQLLSDERGVMVPHNRPTVLPSSHFTQRYVGTGKLRIIAQVKDEATDAEFLNYWAEAKGDQDLAVASFLSAFALDAGDPPTTTKKPRGKAAAE